MEVEGVREGEVDVAAGVAAEASFSVAHLEVVSEVHSEEGSRKGEVAVEHRTQGYDLWLSKSLVFGRRGYLGSNLLACTRVVMKINGHRDKRSSELFKSKWCKQQNHTN